MFAQTKTSNWVHFIKSKQPKRMQSTHAAASKQESKMFNPIECRPYGRHLLNKSSSNTTINILHNNNNNNNTNIHSLIGKTKQFGPGGPKADSNGGSLSSGSNSSTSDDDDDDDDEGDEVDDGADAIVSPESDDDQQVADRPMGLTRSASRVSRFRSAKEFFERLSNVQQSQRRLGQVCGSCLAPAGANRLPQTQPHPAGAASPSQSGLAVALPRPERSASVSCLATASQGQAALRPKGTVADRYIGSLALKSVLQCSPATSQHQPSAGSGPSNQNGAHSSAGPTKRPAAAADSQLEAARPRSLTLPPLQPVAQAAAATATCPAAGKPPPPQPSATSFGVRLHSADTSGLSTNTILHINNSRPSESLSPRPLPALGFLGDNVIVGAGSLLVKRNKQLRISFDEAATATFEYPSEEVLLNCDQADYEQLAGRLDESGPDECDRKQQVMSGGTATTATATSLSSPSTAPPTSTTTGANQTLRRKSKWKF